MMQTIKLSTSTVLLALLISCAPSKNVRQSATTTEQKAKITDLISKMPASDRTESEWLNKELLELGSGGIRTLTRMLIPDGTGNDTYARYALNGLGKYVSRPGAETERIMYEKVLLKELKSDLSKPAKTFLIQQLELAGSDQSINLLRDFLIDDVLYAPAVHALTAVNTPEAKDAVHQALSIVEGKQRRALIKALGDMKVSKAAQDILPYASSDDAQTRNAALYALAKSGNPVAAGVFSQKADTSKNVSYYLLFAKRLTEKGYPGQSSEICRTLLTGDFPAHIKSNALTILVDNEENQALDDLLAAVDTMNPELRSAALSLAEKLPGRETTEAWITKLKQSPPVVQAEIISMLGKRGDPSALPGLTRFLQDNNLEIRLAAIPAVAALGGTGKMQDLIEMLNQSDEASEIKTIKTSLLQLPSESLLPAVSRALSSSPDKAKVALIEILDERHATQYFDRVLNYRTSSDSTVRLAVYQSLKVLATPENLPRVIDFLTDAQNENERAAIQDAVIAISKKIPETGKKADAVLQALITASDSQKPVLLEILSGIGGEKALQAVVKTSKNSNIDVKDAAIHALARWPDASAVPPLFDIAQNASNQNRNAALEGSVRLVQNSNYASKDKIQFLRNALIMAETPEEKALVMEALAAIHTPGALKTLANYFNDSNAAIRDKAINTAAKILAGEYTGSSTSLNSATAALSVIETTVDSNVKQKIEQQIHEIKAKEEALEGFESLFNGQDLSGWTGDKDAYYVSDGAIVSRTNGHGNLFTEETYGDFILRFEFKLAPGANSGLGIRAPLEGDPAYTGMEIQILDNTAEKYADLEPYQYHGSVYGVAPARRGYLKPAGEWNQQEVTVRGSHIKIKLNGQIILDTDIKKASSPETIDGKEHPGLIRNRGHIGFLGHGAKVAFRNIQIRNLNEYLPDYFMNSENQNGLNQPPEGYKALFNGRNLDGWKGLVGNPEKRAGISAEELAKAQIKADSVMRKHWSVRDGILYFDGEGESITTIKKYGDFEMLVDWKIEPHGDSGIYLRGSPQVQIWDITENPVGSGGLYNNQKHLSDPLVPADNAIGEWNHMRIKMIGERVTVHLNGELVVPNVVMENYWNREIPIYLKGQIELQAHNTPLYFRNIFIREIPRTENLFNGKDLTGWQRVGGKTGDWHAGDGILYTEGGGKEWDQGQGGGWLSTNKMFGDFKLELEYRLPEGGNSGVFIRAPHKGDPAYAGMEIQILDDYASQYKNLEAWQYTGSIYDIKAPSERVSKQANEWQKMMIICNGPNVKVSLNDEMIINTNLIDHMKRVNEHPGLKRRRGYIGLQNHNTRIEYRNIKITEIE